MRVTRLYCPQNLTAGTEVALSPESSHYLANVLRMAEGDSLVLFNQDSGECAGTLLSVKKKAVLVAIDKQQREFSPPKLRIDLWLGISRGDRMDYAIQKAVELGANSVTPLYSEYGEVKFKQADRLQRKLEHWQRIAVSAAEQSDRIDVPEIMAPISFGDALGERSEHPVILFDPTGEKKLSQLDIAGAVTVVTGPEGGFSPMELDLAKERSAEIVKLGPRVLRTETAPLAALAVLQHCFGDF